MSPSLPRIVTLQLPVPWEALGFDQAPGFGPTTAVHGDGPAWAWRAGTPRFPVARCHATEGDPVDGWTTDHVVLLAPDLEEATATLSDVGAEPRLRMDVRGRPTAFFRVGPVLEVIESPVRAAAVFGVALATEEPLEVVALRWRGAGFEVTDPTPAMQPGRRIMTVHGLDAGLAIMSLDRQGGPPQTPKIN